MGLASGEALDYALFAEFASSVNLKVFLGASKLAARACCSIDQSDLAWANIVAASLTSNLPGASMFSDLTSPSTTSIE